MERVVTINLNGAAYQLEEPAYDSLRAYLGRAEAALSANPDKAEIIRDLEQAIADKCSVILAPGKNVVNAAEMARVLEEMGPVEGEAEAGAQRTESGAYEGPHKRLYRIKDGANIAGVSTGMAAFFDIDVNIIRLLWIIAAVFTSGAAIVVYIAMMFLVPSAHTSQEWAAAHGMPFNAQEIIERAKREAQNVAENATRAWRRESRNWSQHSRSADWGMGGPPPNFAAAPAQPVGYATRITAGFFAFLFSVVTAVLLIAFLLAFFGLLSAGSVFGWTPPAGVPIWLAIVVLAIAYAAISAPFSAMRRSSFATLGGYRDGGGWTDGLATLAITAIALWFAWMFWPDARGWIDEGVIVIRDFADYWRDMWISFRA
ncbi:MAG TPA: PspC domain-containing protein [Terricaulis sp.]|nr:PspC domain-containing protein [Terricaulis sp.]